MAPPRDESRDTNLQIAVSDKDFIDTLAKGLRIIETFELATTRLTLSEVAARAGATRAAARRFLLTLTALGYMRQDGRHFMLTPKVLVLSRSQLGGNRLFRAAQPLLDAIAESTMESASAAVLTGADILFVARAQSPRPVSINVAVGTRLPAFCTAMGKVLLGELAEPAVRLLLTQTPPRRRSPFTHIDIDEIVAETRRARELGYATSIEEFEPGMNTIAVPVRNPLSDTGLSLGISVPARRMSAQQLLDELLPQLQDAAERLAVA